MEFEAESAATDSLKSIEASPDIVVIQITDDSFTKTGLSSAKTSDRVELYTKLIKALDNSSASTLFIDTVFGEAVNPKPQPAFDRLSTVLHRLRKLRVTLATDVPKGDSWDRTMGDLEDSKEPTSFRFYSHPLWAWDDRTTNLVNVASTECAVTDSGYAGGFLGRIDYRTHRPILFAPFSAVLQFNNIDLSRESIHYSPTGIRAGGLYLETTPQFLAAVRFTSEVNPFTTFDAADVLSALSANPADEKFRNRLCILGDITGDDIVRTSKFDQIHGLYFMAHMTNSLLQELKHGRKDISLPIELAITWLECFGALLALFSGNRLRALLFFGVAFVLTLATPIILLKLAGLSTLTLFPGFTLLLCLVATLIVQSLTSGRFLFKVQGEHSIAAIIFADVHDSTVLIQQIGPEEYQKRVSNFILEAHRIIQKYRGHIERTTGDGFMAVFEAGSQEVAISRAQEALRAILKQPQINDHLTVSYGVEVGTISGGQVIEGGRRAWSSAGVPVTMAQRVQGQAKAHGVSVCYGPGAGSILLAKGEVEPLGQASLKGFESDLDIFAIVVK